MSLTPFYFSFLLPVALIIFINIAIYVLVVVNICRRNVNSIGASRSGLSHEVSIRASFACFVVLGES
jgi:hypothetical protein